MEDSEKEKFITASPEPVSFEGIKKILYQMNNCVCRIYNNGEGTGFFTKIPYKNKLLSVLITNNHVIDKNDIIDNQIITLYLNNDKIEKSIILDDSIINYFKLKEKKDPNYLNKIYSNKSIYNKLS